MNRARPEMKENSSSTLDVQQLPPGKPAGFDPGNVGQWNLSTTVDPVNVAVGQPVTFRLIATGHCPDGAVRLADARVSGQLNFSHAKLTNPAGPVLDLEDAAAKHLFLPAQVICPQGAADRSGCDGAAHRLALSGLAYTSLHGVDWHEWLHLITHHTRDYQPQPYQQLVAALRASGQESTAREVLIAQQRDRYHRGELGSRLRKIAHRLWGALAGYGYRSSRAVFALLLVLVIAAGLGVAAGHTPTGPGRPPKGPLWTRLG